MFDKLKKLFIVSDEEFTKQAGGTPPDQITNSKPSSPSETSKSAVTNQPVQQSTYTSDEKVDQKMLDILFNAIDKNNLEGFDYLEFKNSLQNLGDIAMDEKTRYSSALAMAKTMGASATSIAKSGEHYLKVLANEEAKFNDALAVQKAKIEEEKTGGIKALHDAITFKTRQIEQLNAEISEAKLSLEKAQNEIQNDEQKLESTYIKFKQAYSLVVSQIVEDIKKINANSQS